MQTVDDIIIISTFVCYNRKTTAVVSTYFGVSSTADSTTNHVKVTVLLSQKFDTSMCMMILSNCRESRPPLWYYLYLW